LERREWDAYAAVREEFSKVAWRGYSPEFENPTGSVAVAREWLRRSAAGFVRYNYYVVTDDNAVHASEQALVNLVRATDEFPDDPVVMAGMHNTAPHFDRGKIKLAKTVNGLRSYPTVAMIFQCYPHALYSRYQYPVDAYGLDDRHFFLWCIANKVKHFRVCMDAPFTKSRYQEGGQGPVEERMTKNGLAIARLATDFPKLVGATGTLRLPWQFLLKMQSGHTADRLVGGSMRKEEALTHALPPVTSTRVRVRVRRHSSLTGETHGR
jgi:hypothetical protein